MFFDTKVYSTVTSSYSLLPKPSSAAASIVGTSWLSMLSHDPLDL